MILVKMENFDEELKILRNKRKLARKDCNIENDMTKEERQTQAAISRRAREERAKGHTIKIGFQKIQINRKWEYLKGEMTKKLPDNRDTNAQHPKKKDTINDWTYIATLNIRTLRTSERETGLENALEGIRFKVLGLCELRKDGENIIERENGNILYYYGKAGDIEEFAGISERIAVLKLKINKN
jgi:hypothetical protein